MAISGRNQKTLDDAAKAIAKDVLAVKVTGAEVVVDGGLGQI